VFCHLNPISSRSISARRDTTRNRRTARREHVVACHYVDQVAIPVSGN
jgi:hypothetical protein